MRGVDRCWLTKAVGVQQVVQFYARLGLARSGRCRRPRVDRGQAIALGIQLYFRIAWGKLLWINISINWPYPFMLIMNYYVVGKEGKLLQGVLITYNICLPEYLLAKKPELHLLSERDLLVWDGSRQWPAVRKSTSPQTYIIEVIYSESWLKYTFLKRFHSALKQMHEASSQVICFDGVKWRSVV